MLGVIYIYLNYPAAVPLHTLFKRGEVEFWFPLQLQQCCNSTVTHFVQNSSRTTVYVSAYIVLCCAIVCCLSPDYITFICDCCVIKTENSLTRLRLHMPILTGYYENNFIVIFVVFSRYRIVWFALNVIIAQRSAVINFL